HYYKTLTTLSLLDVAQLYLNTLFVGDPTNIARYWPIMLAGLVFLLAGLALALRVPRSDDAARVFGRWALAAGALAPVVIVGALNLATRFRLAFVPNSRYFVTQIPWATALLGIALAALARRWLRVGLAAGGLTLLAFAVFTGGYYSDRYLSDDYKSGA